MSEINLILKHLESEKTVLQIDLKNCLAEYDYEGAHLFQNALHAKLTEIRAIRRRIECNIDEINSLQMSTRYLEQSIKRYEQGLLKENIDERLTKIYTQRIEYRKKELDEHNNQIILLSQTNRAQHIDNDHLLIGIESILNEETEILCIEIIENDLSFISIINHEAKINIEFSSGATRKESRKITYKVFREKLNQLGFRIDSFLNWNLFLSKKDCTRDQIHQLISTICFEIIRPSKKATCNMIIKKLI